MDKEQIKKLTEYIDELSLVSMNYQDRINEYGIYAIDNGAAIELIKNKVINYILSLFIEKE